MFDLSNPFGLAAAGTLIGACVAQTVAAAQSDSLPEYPTKPIRFIVQSLAGGGTDTIARDIGQKLAETWGCQVIVDNVDGSTHVGSTPEQFSAHIKSEIPKWAKVIKDAGIKPD